MKDAEDFTTTGLKIGPGLQEIEWIADSTVHGDGWTLEYIPDSTHYTHSVSNLLDVVDFTVSNLWLIVPSYISTSTTNTNERRRSL